MKKFVFCISFCLLCLCLCVSANAEEKYLFKEDFDGTSSYKWYTSNNCETQTTNLIDTDSDSKVDSMYHKGSNHLTYGPDETVTFTDGQEIVTETRVKYTPRSGANLLNTDNSVKGNDNTSNGGLLIFRMNGNYWMRLTTSPEGFLRYGGTNGDELVTNYKIYADTWYTIRLTMNETRRGYKIYITDDNGNSYSGPFQTDSYGGGVMTGIGKLCYAYGWFYYSTVDYLYIWDNAALSDITGKYLKNSDLQGAENLDPTDGLNVTFSFENPVTQSDAKKITATGNLALEKSVSEDGCSINVDISNMKYYTSYALYVPRIGNNMAENFEFSTKATPPDEVFETPYFEEDKIVPETPVTANISFTSYKPEDLLVMVVFYNEQNRVTRSVTSVATTGKYGKETISVKALPFKGDVKARVFVWKRFDTMQPLTPMAEITY